MPWQDSSEDSIHFESTFNTWYCFLYDHDLLVKESNSRNGSDSTDYDDKWPKKSIASCSNDFFCSIHLDIWFQQMSVSAGRHNNHSIELEYQDLS